MNIPILLFSVDYRHPIVVDKYYQAKALSDMIIIVQNSQQLYPSRLQCNSVPIFINLRNPVKAALAATGLLVGGLIPNHITYSEAHQNAIQNWLWSVGNHPFSHTSTGKSFNRIQIDTMRRNAIVQSLSDSIKALNRGIKILQNIHIDSSNVQVAELLRLNRISILHNQITSLFKKVSGKVASFDFSAAMKHALDADDLVDDFLDEVFAIDNTFTAFRCLPYTIEDADPDSKLIMIIPILFICFDILLIVTVFLCRSGK